MGIVEKQKRSKLAQSNLDLWLRQPSESVAEILGFVCPHRVALFLCALLGSAAGHKFAANVFASGQNEKCT